MSVKCDKCGASSVDKEVFRTKVEIQGFLHDKVFASRKEKELKAETEGELVFPIFFDVCYQCGSSLVPILETAIEDFLFPDGLFGKKKVKKKTKKKKSKIPVS